MLLCGTVALGKKYPDREHPRKEVYERLLNRFRATGNVAYEKVTITKSITDNEDNKMQVLQSVIENPNTSTRVIANEVDISHNSVWRTLTAIFLNMCRNYDWDPLRAGLNYWCPPLLYRRSVDDTAGSECRTSSKIRGVDTKQYKLRTETDLQAFYADLINAPFYLVFDSEDIDDKISVFNSLPTSLLDAYAPYKTCRTGMVYKPWITNTIKDMQS
ncbi:hypothetical protein QE152_g36245 [Popillia japonica]|uniref:DUF4817 domain-containing protein n=1 Tax=Popillia japonica TaxID=7064 RepID=A0AAW1IDH6_POPJA